MSRRSLHVVKYADSDDFSVDISFHALVLCILLSYIYIYVYKYIDSHAAHDMACLCLGLIESSRNVDIQLLPLVFISTTFYPQFPVYL